MRAYRGDGATARPAGRRRFPQTLGPGGDAHQSRTGETGDRADPARPYQYGRRDYRADGLAGLGGRKLPCVVSRLTLL